MKKLSDIGEREAIKIVFGIMGDITGDDCALVDLGEEYLLVSTDMIAQSTHIPKEMTPFQIGWFIVSINLSDIASKGGSPLGLVLSYGLPRNTSEDFLKELTRGAKTCALKFNTRIMGGDTKETKEITLCGTALGLVKKEEFMPRKGAKPGDIVAVTGTLGKAGAAYYSKDKTPLLEPIPRLKEGRVLASQKCVTSSIDISDGLSSSLYQLKEINEVGFEIDFNLLPISPNVAESIALHFGGDYELLVTIPASRFSKVRKEMNKNGLNLFPIGRVTEEKEIVIVKKKKRKILEDKGYQHFTNV